MSFGGSFLDQSIKKAKARGYLYLSARVRVAVVNTGRFIAVLNYGVSVAVGTVFNTVHHPNRKPSLCEVGGMYGVDTTV